MIDISIQRSLIHKNLHNCKWRW